MALVQILRNIVNLNKELLFLPLYFALPIYILVRFASSHQYFWLLKLLLLSKNWRKLIINILLTKLVDLIIGAMGKNIVIGDILARDSIIGVFFYLSLI